MSKQEQSTSTPGSPSVTTSGGIKDCSTSTNGVACKDDDGNAPDPSTEGDRAEAIQPPTVESAASAGPDQTNLRVYLHKESNQWRFRDDSGIEMAWSTDANEWQVIPEGLFVENGEWCSKSEDGTKLVFRDGEWKQESPPPSQKDTQEKSASSSREKSRKPPDLNAEKDGASSTSSESELESDVDDFEYQIRQNTKESKRRERMEKQGKQLEWKDADGTEYEYDAFKKAWLPKIDDDFLAQYQANYGNYVELDPPQDKKDGTTTDGQQPSTSASDAAEQKEPLDPKEAKKLARQRKRAAEKNAAIILAWFEVDEAHNTNVYVTNLPTDITLEEFEELMTKYGIIDRDLLTKKLKLKLYYDEMNNPKGDGRCCYVKVESVPLALQMLDGMVYKGRELHAERAQFQLRGEYDPSKKKRMSAKQKKKLKAKQEKMFDWRPEKLIGERPKSDCIIVIKNLFSVEEFMRDASLLFDVQELLRVEATKYGEVRKIVVYDNNSEGVATIGFALPAQADDFLTMTDYRVLRGRQVRATRWDGKTSYKIEETEEQRKKRIEEWERSLEK